MAGGIIRSGSFNAFPNMEKQFTYLDRMIRQLGRMTLLSVVVGFIVLLGLIRCITGAEYALSVFFMFPIFFATWYAGLASGICMSVLSTISWLSADLFLLGEFSDAYVPFINETFRLIVFLFVNVLVWKFKKTLEIQWKIARTDSLTGMPNRLAFFEAAELEISRARRFDYPLSVIYLDVDNFKFVNDTFGHESGDHLLQVVADTILKNIRKIDIATRFGGDEMGVLLAKTDAGGARALSEKLKSALTAQMDLHGWPVTFSIGVGTFENVLICPRDMIHVADKLMYCAKKNGKNRVAHQTFIGNPDEKTANNGIRLHPCM